MIPRTSPTQQLAGTYHKRDMKQQNNSRPNSAPKTFSAKDVQRQRRADHDRGGNIHGNKKKKKKKKVKRVAVVVRVTGFTRVKGLL